MDVKAIHNEGGDEPAVQDISGNQKLFLKNFHHAEEDLTGAQFHHNFADNHYARKGAKTDVSPPPAESLISFKPEELHISDVPSVTFKK
jgi:hypothetical protein